MLLCSFQTCNRPFLRFESTQICQDGTNSEILLLNFLSSILLQISCRSCYFHRTHWSACTDCLTLMFHVLPLHIWSALCRFPRPRHSPDRWRSWLYSHSHYPASMWCLHRTPWTASECTAWGLRILLLRWVDWHRLAVSLAKSRWNLGRVRLANGIRRIY